ncbi:MAG TPA: ASCH domain-containing protein [Phytomonospora sp.]
MWPRVDGLRGLELGSPGELRRRLTNLVLAGEKTATAGLLAEYTDEGEELEHVGERLALIDDDGTRAATVEITAIAVVPFAEVPFAFALDEGEGYTSIEHWREAHARFWAGEGTRVDDATEIACLRFHVVRT